jgi:hypothetical protein
MSESIPLPTQQMRVLGEREAADPRTSAELIELCLRCPETDESSEAIGV